MKAKICWVCGACFIIVVARVDGMTQQEFFAVCWWIFNEAWAMFTLAWANKFLTKFVTMKTLDRKFTQVKLRQRVHLTGCLSER